MHITLTLLGTESQLRGSGSQVTTDVAFCHERKAAVIYHQTGHYLVNIHLPRRTQDRLELNRCS